MKFTPIFKVLLATSLLLIHCSLSECQRRPRRLPIRRPSGSRLPLPNRLPRIPRRKPIAANFALPPPGRELVVPALDVPFTTVQQGGDEVRGLQQFFATGGTSAISNPFVGDSDSFQQATSTQRPPLSREQRAMLSELKTILGGEPLPIDPTSERSLSFATASVRGHRSLPLFPPYDSNDFDSANLNHFTEKGDKNIEGEYFEEEANFFKEENPADSSNRFSQTTPNTWAGWTNINNSQLSSEHSSDGGSENIQNKPTQVQQFLLNHISSDTAGTPEASQNTVSNLYHDTTLDYIARFRQALLSRTEAPPEAWQQNTERSSSVNTFNTHQSARRSGLRPLRGSNTFGYDTEEPSQDTPVALQHIAHQKSVASTTLPSPVFIPFGRSSNGDSTQGLPSRAQNSTESGVGISSTARSVARKENRLLTVMPQDPDLLCSKTEAELGFCDTVNKYPRRYMDRVLDQCSTILEYLYSEVPELKAAQSEINQLTAASDATEIYSSWSWSKQSSPSCHFRSRQMMPTYARATDHRWYVLLQHGHVLQRVTVNTCDEVAGSRSGCRQHFHYRTLIAADPRLPTKCPRMRTFRFPAGCTCSGDFEQRGF